MEPNPEEITIAAHSIGERTERVTAQSVEDQRAKEKEASIALLDAMEASVEQQGQWFVPIGEKKPITETRDVEERRGSLGRRSETVQVEETVGHEDTRAFILKTPRKHVEHDMPITDFVVATTDGTFYIRTFDDQTSEHSSHPRQMYIDEFKLLSGLTDGTLQLDQESKYIPPQRPGGNIVADLHLVGRDMQDERVHSSRFSLYPNNGEISGEEFRGLIEASIAKTESPHKANLERAQANTQLAHDAAGVISSLPPRE